MDDLYIKKVLNGDREAFRYFIRNYQEMAYSIAISLVKEEDVAKDIVQESFIQAYSSLSSFRRESKFSSWLYRIVVNKGLKYVSWNKKRRQETPLADVSEAQMAESQAALKTLEQEELRKFIFLILHEMPAKEALVMKLFYLEENKLSEIEELTGFTSSNIKVLLHRARKRFYHLTKNEHIQSQFKDLIQHHEGKR